MVNQIFPCSIGNSVFATSCAHLQVSALSHQHCRAHHQVNRLAYVLCVCVVLKHHNILLITQIQELLLLHSLTQLIKELKNTQCNLFLLTGHHSGSIVSSFSSIVYQSWLLIAQCDSSEIICTFVVVF